MGGEARGLEAIIEGEDSGFSVVLGGFWKLIVANDTVLHQKEDYHILNNELLVGIMEACCQAAMSRINKGFLPAENDRDLYSGVFMKFREVLDEKPGFPRFIKSLYEIDRGYFIPFLPIGELLKFSSVKEDELPELFIKGFAQRNPNNNEEARFNPYINMAIPIGHDATCSAPYMVMTYNIIADLFPKARIFEAGTGCGYHLASTANISPDFTVFSADIVPDLCRAGIDNIKKLPNGEEILKRVAVENANCLEPENEFMRKNAPYNLIYFTFLFPYNQASALAGFLQHLDEDGILVVPLQDKRLANSGKLIAFEKKGKGMPIAYDLGAVLFTNAVGG